MVDKPIKWSNILLHCAVAVPMGATCGGITHIGWVYGGPLGTGQAILGALAGLGVVLYWPARERIQHGFEWGKKQSQLEWIIPSALAPVGMALGWWVSSLLL